MFGEVPFAPIIPSEPVHFEQHLILPCYGLPTNPLFVVWSNVFPLFSQCKDIECYEKIITMTLTSSEYDFTHYHLRLLQALPKEERDAFVTHTLPIVFSLASIHYRLFLSPIRYLSNQHSSASFGSISASNSMKINRLQVASLLSLAFLGLLQLPAKFQDIKKMNKMLFVSGSVSLCKFKCYVNYFNTIGRMVKNNDNALKELVYFERTSYDLYNITTITQKLVSMEDKMNFDMISVHEGNLIENDANTIKAIFSSKNIGGNILDDGCSQEEIMFLKCPEGLFAMLINGILDLNESVKVLNVLQYNNVVGYTSTLQYDCDVSMKNVFVYHTSVEYNN